MSRVFPHFCSQAFNLFDQDGDGMVTTEELRKLIGQVGGDMSEGEAKGIISKVKELSSAKLR